MADKISSTTTRLICISDTHSKYEFSLPPGDILLHSGDFTLTGRYEEMDRFLNWLKSLTQFRLKIVIAGNHDVTLDRVYYRQNWKRFHRSLEDIEKIRTMFEDPTLRNQYGIVYLEDQTFVDPVTKLKFYGSPWQPEFCSWAFNVPRNSQEIRRLWDQIPTDTDVLLTHGPPHGILDMTSHREHVGCEALLKRVQIVRPQLHVFGHIHEHHGKEQPAGQSTIFVNASICTLGYRPTQPPIVVDLPIKQQD